LDIQVTAGDLLIFRADSEFSIDPGRVSWDLDAFYTQVCSGGSCTSLTKNDLTQPLKPGQAQVYYPVNEYLPRAARKPLSIPEDGTLSVMGSVGVSGPATLAIRSENRLIYQQPIPAPGQSFFMSFPVSANESITLELLSQTEADANRATIL